MIELKDVRLSLSQPDGKANEVLKGIDLSLPTGTFAMVVGANGSGKSTLLNVIAGPYIPDSGTVRIDEHDVTRQSECRRAALIGRVFQNPLHGTCPSLTVAENMRLAELRGQLRGLAIGLRQGEKARYRDALARCEMGLENRLDQTTGSLSGGQRQALTLILATLRKPKILLLDEPTAALDPRSVEQIERLTSQIIADHQLTSIMVTHSMSQAVEMGTQTIVIHDGRVAQTYSAAERATLTPETLRTRLAEIYRQTL